MFVFAQIIPAAIQNRQIFVPLHTFEYAGAPLAANLVPMQVQFRYALTLHQIVLYCFGALVRETVRTEVQDFERLQCRQWLENRTHLYVAQPAILEIQFAQIVLFKCQTDESPHALLTKPVLLQQQVLWLNLQILQ